MFRYQQNQNGGDINTKTGPTLLTHIKKNWNLKNLDKSFLESVRIHLLALEHTNGIKEITEPDNLKRPMRSHTKVYNISVTNVIQI